MSLSDRIARLEPRERRLLGIMGAVLGAMIFLAVPIGIAATVHSKSSENDAIRDAITSIEDGREAVEKERATRDAVTQRYASPAPPLATFLSKVAAEAELDIPESQDRQAMPHGKRYTERSTKITLRKVGMLKLVRLMEKIETSGHPVALSSLNIHKRGSEPDSFDVDMVVSAYDRKAPEPKKEPKPAASGEGESPDGEAVRGASE
jgi:general secretion pathway protein M